jgi:DedD protein
MAAEQLTDQEKVFRVRARRRLIGAVALVLLMLTVLPMLLDDRSNQNMPVPDVAISIPSQDDGNFASKIVPVAPAPALPDSPEAPADPVSSPTVTPIAPEVKPAIEAKSDIEAKPAIEKVEKPEAAKPSVIEKPTAIEKPAVTEKSTDEKPVTAKKGAFSVQVGVISEGEKVKQVLAKIADTGLKSTTENLNTPTGIKVRIRSGPYASKAEAEQALETLKAAGFKPILVTHK